MNTEAYPHALARFQEGRYPEAEDLAQALCRESRRPADWRLLGAAQGAQGKVAEAEQSFRMACRLDPADASARRNLALALSEQGKQDEAVQEYETLLALVPGDVEARLQQARLLLALNRHDQALAACEQGRVHCPDAPVSLYLLQARALNTLNRWGEAEAVCREALKQTPEQTPEQPDLWCQLGVALVSQGRADEAMGCYDRALALRPDSLPARQYRAGALQQLRRYDEALAEYRQILASQPNNPLSHHGVAQVSLLRGEYGLGFQEYAWRQAHGERRVEAAVPPIAALPPWLAGRTVFLMGEQGLGDTLFFLRFANELKARGARLIGGVDPRLRGLLSRAGLFAALPSEAFERYTTDLSLPVGDLPAALGFTGDSGVPPALPLVPHPDRMAALRRRLEALGPGPTLCVTWRAGTRGKARTLSKESPLERLAALLRPHPARVLMVQRQPEQGEIGRFAEILGRAAHDFSAVNDDLEDMLALMALADDYIGVSNTNMHLRAGVGKTARVLVPNPPEWRWMAEGDESPWFPGCRVYRQGMDGDWSRAYERLSSDLAGGS